jgi:hypothetical protein
MNRSELERAWPAAEPPPGFADRVLDHVQRGPLPPEPASRRASWLERLTTPRARWLALPAVVLALAGLFLLWPTPTVREGDVIAAEPRVVSIGERVVAELSSGAQVTYRVVPGERFRVQTPHGSVAVLGTVFRVVVAGRDAVEGEPMKKHWAMAGAGVTLGALLFVSVDRGSVSLSKGERELVLDAGQSGSIGPDGVPRLEAAAPIPPAAARAPEKDDAERARARQVADAVRRHAARRRAATEATTRAPEERASEQAPSEPTPPPIVFSPTPQSPPPPRTPEESRRREYIRRTVREQYFPVARDCYEELLERQPTAAGRLTLEFAIVGDADAGVVDRVAVRDDDTTIDDPEFQLCMSESMYTAVFEPPPPGTSETTIVYPITLAPE